MYILLTLFFISLTGIILMIGRKLVVLESMQVSNRNRFILKPEYLEELKYATIRTMKKHGYTSLVATIRFYVQSTNFLKRQYREIELKIKEIHAKRQKNNPDQKKEINKFLKVISEYKHKIREIKHRIKEEEEGF